jgi:pSer/pThr/pTyr-binding forkhead associated (FHA) protein
VTGTLFAIGRQEPPFNTFDNALVSKLSRRHARLFEQDGCVYLADLGSLNGTSWNGEAVKHLPVALRTGDILEFGGLEFEAEVTVEEVEPPTGAVAAVQRLVLTPQRFKELLEPIVVSSFPFLFDKSSEVFDRHKGELRDVLSYMSRHHAHIFLRNDELYVEDLGSTNGTYVSGRKLDERARLLKDGDTIALGSDRLVYAVHLLRSAESGATQVPSGIEAVDNPTRTIFVDSPTSFLDVYFVGDRRDGHEAEQSSSENGSGTPASGKGAGGGPGLLTELSRSFFGGAVFGRTARRALAGGVVAAAAVVGLWYWQGREVRAIEAAMAREDYAQAVVLAQSYLAERPDSPAIRELATRGAVLLWVPTWMSQLREKQHDGAAATVDDAVEAVRGNPEALTAMELLGWSTDVRALLSGGPAGDDINALIERARGVSNLLDWWQGNSWSHARTLDRIAAAMPEFQDAREQIYSDVRQLRSEALDYRPLIELNQRLSDALKANELNRAGRLISEFIDAHPQFPDSVALAQDLARLQRLNAHIEAERWLDGYRQLQGEAFTTAPFADYGNELGERLLPDAATIARLEDVKRLWHEGEMEGALAQLETLSRGRWANIGGDLEQRYRRLLAGYQSLQISRGEQDYAESLFAYYGTLRESEDGFLLAQLEQEFLDHADAAVRRSGAYLDEAEAAWLSYQRGGGIQPEHRMQERVSADFSALAGALKQAVGALRRCQRIHRQVSRTLPPGWAELEEQVSREVAFQRGQLQSLAFHEPAVQRRMLSLLPEPLREEAAL